MQTIEYWRHMRSGETWAILAEYGTGVYPVKVLGACGPLNYTEVTAANLAEGNFNWDEDPDDFQEQHEDYALVEPPYSGDLAAAET